MEAKASAKYIRGSAQKARLVVDLVRGKTVNQALATLQFTNKRAADPVEACVRSAIANATETAERANIAVDPDDLWIKEAFVDKGPTKSRFRTRPAPQGRAFRERRHFCHITIKLSSDERPTTKRSVNDGDATARRSARKSVTTSPRERAGESATSTAATTATVSEAAVVEQEPIVTPTENLEPTPMSVQTEVPTDAPTVPTETPSSDVDTTPGADATTEKKTEDKTEE